MSIPDLIANAGERLTPTDRLIAEAVLEEPTLLAFGTVSDLAQRVGTSRPSIVRFATKLGFGGYSELQESVRASLSAQLLRPDQRIRHQEESLAPARRALEAAARNACEALDAPRLEALAAPIVAARAVWILSGETSRAGAHTLFSGLSMIRPEVTLIDEHFSASQLSDATVGDVAVVFDFARYRRHSVIAARSLSELGLSLVAITDGPLSPLAALTETWCALQIPAVGPFDSSVPAVVAAELLVAQVAGRIREQARARIDRTEALWRAAGTYYD